MDHDAHSHTDVVARRGRHQRRGPLGGEVVQEFLGLPGHGRDRSGGFPQLTLQNPVGPDKLVRRGSQVAVGRFLAETPDFRKELIPLEVWLETPILPKPSFS